MSSYFAGFTILASALFLAVACMTETLVRPALYLALALIVGLTFDFLLQLGGLT